MIEDRAPSAKWQLLMETRRAVVDCGLAGLSGGILVVNCGESALRGWRALRCTWGRVSEKTRARGVGWPRPGRCLVIADEDRQRPQIQSQSDAVDDKRTQREHSWRPGRGLRAGARGPILSGPRIKHAPTTEKGTARVRPRSPSSRFPANRSPLARLRPAS